MNVFITDEHFERAAAIGISKQLLRFRVREMCWDIEQSVTTPPRKRRKVSEHWVEVAAQNGITRALFLCRLNAQGWSEEKAATTTRLEAKRESIAKQKRVLTPEERERALTAGLNIGTVRHRLKKGWSTEAAITTPALPPNKRRQGIKNNNQW